MSGILLKYYLEEDKVYLHNLLWIIYVQRSCKELKNSNENLRLTNTVQLLWSTKCINWCEILITNASSKTQDKINPCFFIINVSSKNFVWYLIHCLSYIFWMCLFLFHIQMTSFMWPIPQAFETLITLNYALTIH